MKLLPGCVGKLFVGRIQTRHTDFLLPQVCGILSWGCRLVVQTCSHQLIALIDKKFILNYSFKTVFFGTWVYRIYWIRVDWSWNLSPCVRKVSVIREIGHTSLLSLKVCGRLWQGFPFCGFTWHHQYTDWLQVNHLKILLLSFFSLFSWGEEELIYKHHQWWLIVAPRGAKAHFFYTLQFFLMAARKSSLESRPMGHYGPLG